MLSAVIMVGVEDPNAPGVVALLNDDVGLAKASSCSSYTCFSKPWLQRMYLPISTSFGDNEAVAAAVPFLASSCHGGREGWEAAAVSDWW